jgi:ABC-type amino acid transport substrate-binding protein
VTCRRSAVVLCVALLLPSAAGAQADVVLRWGGDAEGGAPYVEADPTDPSRVVGFDVEVAELLASALGRTPQFVQVGFTSIDAEAGPPAISTSVSAASKTVRPARAPSRHPPVLRIS